MAGPQEREEGPSRPREGRTASLGSVKPRASPESYLSGSGLGGVGVARAGGCRVTRSPSYDVATALHARDCKGSNARSGPWGEGSSPLSASEAPSPEGEEADCAGRGHKPFTLSRGSAASCTRPPRGSGPASGQPWAAPNAPRGLTNSPSRSCLRPGSPAAPSPRQIWPRSWPTGP